MAKADPFNMQWDPTQPDPRPARPTSPTEAAAAPAPSAPPPGVVGLTPGYNPDWANLIKSDPAYLSWANNSERTLNDSGAQRKAALQALAVQYGGLPAGFSDKFGDIDQTTLDLARGNQFSDVARLGRSYDQGIEAMKKALAARNALSSGDLVYGQQQADYQRGASEYDLGRQYGDQATNVLNRYVDVFNQARSGESNALNAAAQNVYSNPANRPVDGKEAQLVTDWKVKYGKPVYQAPDGSLYSLDANGNPTPFDPAAGNSPNPSSGVAPAAALNSLDPDVVAAAAAALGGSATPTDYEAMNRAQRLY